MTEKVYWTDEEKEQLVKATGEILLRHPGRSILSCVQGVLGQWPEARRRRIITLVAIPWLEEGVTTLVQQRLSAITQLDVQIRELTDKLTEAERWTAALEQRNQTLEADNKQLQSAMASGPEARLETALVHASLSQLLGATFNQLVPAGTALLDRVERVVTALDRLSSPTEEKLPHLSNGKTATAPRLPKLLIVGNNESQFAQLQTRLKGLCTLIHVGADKTDKTARGLPQCERAIVVVKFCSHALRESVQANYGKDRVLFVNGGLADTEAAIRKYLEGASHVISR